MRSANRTTPSPDAGQPAVLEGGPADDTEILVDPDAVEAWVTHADGTRHLYERVHAARLHHEERIVIFRWRGCR